MNKLKGSLAAKIVAIVLLAASCLALLGAGLGVAFLEEHDAYRSESTEGVRGRLIDKELERQEFLLLEALLHTRLGQVGADSRWGVELLDRDWQPLWSNLREEETVERSMSYDVYDRFGGLYFQGEDQPLTAAHRYAYDGPEPTPRPVEQDTETAPEGTRVCWLRVSWTDKSDSGSFSTVLRVYERLFPLRYAFIAVAVGAFVMAVLLFAFLMAAAGHHDASGEVRASFVEIIPADLLLLICGTGAALLLIAGGSMVDPGAAVTSGLTMSICLIGAGLLLLLFLMSAAVRLKLGSFLENCLIWRVLRWLGKGITAAWGGMKTLLGAIPLVWKWIPVFAVLMFVDFLLTFSFRRDGDVLAFIKLLQWALLAAALLYLVLCFQRLRKGAKAIAAGEENVVIDEKYMIGDIREHAEDLTHIRDGLGHAVDERMKSERLRTELITNVSHDIKTPLTSIINYVDLLSKEDLPGDEARGYVEVLQRQSERLKKLTDDLVEASKASTGNLPTNPERLELGVLVDQLAGEYGEKLTDKGLELRVTKLEEPAHVQADPRQLWRMLDNLMGNVLKYAQPGTRVYLDLERCGKRAVLCLRNISAAPLNLRPEELTERFVRGDASRSTEGSGLGLAITASLAKLQDIQMELSVDGDLFKVVLSFRESE